MSDENDDGQQYALMALARVLAVVVVLALAIHNGAGRTAKARRTVSRRTAW